MKPTNTWDTHLDLGVLGEQHATFSYDYSAGYPDRWYMPNGDPGYPGEPPSVEIYKTTWDNPKLASIEFEDLDKDTQEDILTNILELEAANRNNPDLPEER